jgi:predicted nucleic acid-binding protein
VKKKSLLDSYAVLAYLKQEERYKKVKDLLSSDEVRILMNDINVGETYYILARERGRERAEYFLNIILPSLPITVLGNSLQEVIQAAVIKSEYPISYADAFVVATAQREGATIITGDPDFKQVEDLVKIEWL